MPDKRSYVNPRDGRRTGVKCTPQEIKEDLKQNWKQNTYQRHYTDQFGFRITYGVGVYHLFYKENEVTTMQLYSLQAAKEISIIILNDIIMHKP